MKTLLLFVLIGIVSAVVLEQTKGFGCTLCQDFVTALEKELENDEGTIEQKADKVCDKLANGNSFIDTLCKSMVNTEIEKIVAGIENNDPPEKICKNIGMC
uniref:Saposin B-type domain-containing protein n=1 Tax=Panagrolaimus sp. JU765 TaxID=591449 RepID=A0AC34R886_9BILA